jgi:hypothetical protein
MIMELAITIGAIVVLAASVMLYLVKDKRVFTILQRALIVFVSLNAGFASLTWILFRNWFLVLFLTAITSPVAFTVSWSHYRRERRQLKKMLFHKKKADEALRDGRMSDFNENEFLEDTYRTLLTRVKEAQEGLQDDPR